MQRVNRLRWALLITANVMLFCVLGFYQALDAAQPKANPPFANAVEQREAMIAELKAITVELKEQNNLLRSGKLKVVVVPDAK